MFLKKLKVNLSYLSGFISPIVFNRIVFGVALLVLLTSFWFILQFDIQTTDWLSTIITVGFILINSWALHTLFNIVHLATHSLLGKKFLTNRIIGNIASFFGGITFSDFYTTHLLHHANQGNAQKDPDYWITRSGSIWTIPFKIMYHDVWFWKHNLNQRKNLGRDYFITRLIQISLVLTFVAAGNTSAFLMFWLTPMLIVGYMNGLFLFYYPHYRTKLEKSLSNAKQLNVLGKALLEAISISRVSHEVHHDQPNNNQVYYPVSWAMWNQFYGSWETIKSQAEFKYTEV